MPDPVEYEILKDAVLFKGMSDSELDVVSKKVFLKPYKKGSTLFVEGMPGEVLYIVAEGSVDIIKKTKDGDKVIANLGKGEIVGEMSLIDSGARTATGKTGEDSKLIVITKNSFMEMLDSDPAITSKILMALLRIINRRLRVTDKKFEQ
ncbi:MAG TPA: cyclic nucleotide-binding domain-containing protein [Candidatus Goldiibacteriota bacterium]|nr:cyclic nucleotide-binding domain-containing protein [Candidatus Goldiibacteriota bacterium]